MAEDVIHHLPQVQLRIPVLPPEFFDTLLNRLQALSLRPMKTLHPCPEAIQAASSRKHSLVFFSLFPFSQTVKQVSLKPVLLETRSPPSGGSSAAKAKGLCVFLASCHCEHHSGSGALYF